MTTVASFLYSTHDELLARRHSDRSSRVGASEPKLTSSLDSEPAASGTDSDVEDDYTFLRASTQMTRVASYFPNSIHDEVLARCHSDRSSHVGASTPKLMSSLDFEPTASCTASDADYDTFLRASTEMTRVTSYFPNSIHDEFLARCHSDRSTQSLHGVGSLARCHPDRSSLVGATTLKLMSSLDYDPAADSDLSDDDTCSRASSFEEIVWGSERVL
ncbi:hypothetical protein T484DRAFT_1761124 [Baffinella frigidus]|nr:hypothetical protein T484DRAFT_3645193 [Cryptophyta sp. CCMP2293]KAJ1495760.1 hypothetical protein T484DRAFT_1761124 [Cryptophyta sp. CCMP2293]